MSSANNTTRTRDLRALHGGLLLGLLALPVFVPGLRQWPLFLLVPLTAYGVMVCSVAPLFRSIRWVRAGRCSLAVIGATAAIILISCPVLVLYDLLFQPDLGPLAGQLPLELPVSWVMAGVLFAVLNALLEEAIFRGVLLDALASQVGPAGAVAAQALLFGAVHEQGYPPGAVGVVLASIYGLLLGLLCWRSQGLAAPVVAHIFADITIFWIVVVRLK